MLFNGKMAMTAGCSVAGDVARVAARAGAGARVAARAGAGVRVSAGPVTGKDEFVGR